MVLSLEGQFVDRWYTDLPQPKTSCVPTWTHIQNLKELHEKYKSMQDKYCNKQHRIKT